MDLTKLTKIISQHPSVQKTFEAHNFGCRVNAAEINLLSQIVLGIGFTPLVKGVQGGFSPGIILVNTCSITKKGDIESIGKIRHLSKQHPDSLIIATGCANLKKIADLPNVITFSNQEKEDILSDLNCAYTPAIKDKFSHTNRYLLKVQSGCTQFCSYCTVPYKRQYLWSLPISKAIQTVQQAIDNGYTELIITGVNLDQYQPGFSTLLESILTQTDIKLISFGSIPINCIDDQFISLLSKYSSRFSPFLHIPIQSGSDKILKLMNRLYNKEQIITAFKKLKQISLVKGRNGEAERDFKFGTDLIVGFPTESEADFQQSYELCQQIGFDKIHTFRYSSRPNTLAAFYHQKNPKIPATELKRRSSLIRSLVK